MSRYQRFHRSARFQALVALISLALTFTTANRVPGQPPALDPAPTATEIGLEEAAFQAASGHGLDALDHYQRILDTAADELVPITFSRAGRLGLAQITGSGCLVLPTVRSHWRSARWVCHDHISRLPPALLNIYRDRVDRLASKMLANAERSPDDGPLEKLLADFFCSSSGETAVLQLANRAFERGDFERARAYWAMLLPDSGVGNGPSLCYPSPRIDPAAVEARLILVKLFKAEREAAQVSIQQFRKQFPAAKGLLAGKDGNFADTLDELFAHPERTRLGPKGADADRWTSFGGADEHDGFVSGKLPHYWPDRPTWESAIPAKALKRKATTEEAPFPLDHPSSLAFHPVIYEGFAYLNDATTVYAYDLMTGARTTIFDLDRSNALPGIDSRLPVRTPTRFSSTIANDHLLVRLGTQRLQPPQSEPQLLKTRDNYSCIVCLGPLTGSKPAELSERWRLLPPGQEKDPTVIFDGSPIVRGNRIYGLVWRSVGGDGVYSIVCYDNPDRSQKPELLWKKEIGKGLNDSGGTTPTPQNLLTLAGSKVVYCTNTGNILALDADTGLIAWAYQYPRIERNGVSPAVHEPTPCLYHAGYLFAAPADTDAVYCLSAETGRLHWVHDGIERTQFLGVTQGRLICSFGGVARGIRGIPIDGGKGWTNHEDGGIATFGRGLVAADLVLWPTKHGLHFLNPADGTPVRQSIPGLLGNLAFADGFLVVTTPTEIWGYVAERKYLNFRLGAVEADPTDFRAQYELALAEADAGKWQAARARLQKIATLSPLWREARERWREVVNDQFQAQLLHDHQKAVQTLSEDSSIRQDSEASVLAHLANLDSTDPVAHRDQLAEIRKVGRATGLAIRGPHGELTPLAQWESTTPLAAVEAKNSLPKRSGQNPGSRRGTEAVARTVLSTRSYPGLLPVVPLHDQSRCPPLSQHGGKVYRWEANEQPPRQFADLGFEPLQATNWGDLLVFMGEEGIAAVSATTGAIRWQIKPSGLQFDRFSNHQKEFTPGSIRDLRDPMLAPKLSAFRQVEGTLYAQVDRVEMICIRLESGFIVWNQLLKQLPTKPDLGVKYQPFYHASKDSVLAPLTSGAILCLNANGCRIVHASSPKPWIQDPVAMGTTDIVFASTRETVERLNVETGKIIWKKQLDFPLNGTGEYPQLRAAGVGLLVCWPRNHGYELDYLNGTNGERVWPQPLFLGPTSFHLQHAGINESTLQFVDGGKLRTVSLSEGKFQADIALPYPEPIAWQVLSRPSVTLIYPVVPMMMRDERQYQGEAFSGSISLPRLAGWLTNRYDGWMNRKLPILSVDANSDKVVQRLAIPARGPAVAAVTDRAGAWFIVGEFAEYLSLK